MAIVLKSRVSKNEVRLVSVRDTAIDWHAMKKEHNMSIEELRELYLAERKSDLLIFKEGEVPTVFCFADPRSAESYDVMQNLMIRMSAIAESKGSVESNRVIWDTLYIGHFDGIWEGTPVNITRDKKGHINDAFIQGLIDAKIYGELALAVVAIFAASMSSGASVAEDSKS